MRLGLLPKPPLPDFLGIGVPKAGTTWLYGNLRSHPNLYLPDRKEIHYFDSAWFQTVDWYSELFAEAAGRLKGEVTPAYCALPRRRIRSLRALMPELRLLLLLRDPVQRDWSHLRWIVLRDKNRDPTKVTPDDYITVAGSDKRLERGNYLAILQRWLEVVDKSSLFIGFYEDIADRPRELLEKIFHHIGLSPPHPWERLPIGQRLRQGIEASPPPPVIRYLVERHQVSVDQLIPIIGAAPVVRWQEQWAILERPAP